MKFVDAHIHLSDEEYSKNIDEIIQESRNAGLAALVSNSMNLKTSMDSLSLAERYRGFVHAALGVHPWNVNTLTDEELQQTLGLIEKHRGDKLVVAVGEIGLDFKYAKIWDRQMGVFESMLHMAEKVGLPVIVHSRGTTAQIVEMLPSYGVRKVLLHWFSNPISALSKAVEKGYYITEGPPAVYSNGIRDVVSRVPLENLLTETDGPVRFFKSPFDGKRTTSAFIPLVVKAVADVKNMDVEHVAEQVIRNFEAFFGVRLN